MLWGIGPYLALRHVLRVRAARKRELAKAKERSPRWDHFRDEFIHRHPVCAACGCLVELQVHHVVPFSVNPALELLDTNLLVLCMGPHECHFRIGHGGSFKCHNPRVEKDAEVLRLLPNTRPEVEARAKKTRVRS